MDRMSYNLSEIVFESEGGLEKVKRIREECALRNQADIEAAEDHLLYCPGVFDGVLCWNRTLAGTVASQPCPDFVVGYQPSEFSRKLCQENGTWFHHPQTGLEWTNYTECVDLDDFHQRMRILAVYVTGYSISLAALVISMVIFTSFRSLDCTRIRIHKNLFCSFIMNNAGWIVTYKCVVENPAVIRENGVLHVLLHFFMVSNFSWMFCEGLHLHLVLVYSFYAEKVRMAQFYVVGWVLPSLIIVAYSTVRAFIEKSTAVCWLNECRSTYILSFFVISSMVTNLFFLINIVRLLVTKLKSSVTPAATRKSTLRAVKATLILIPLLGLYYMLLPFRPADHKSPEGIVYEYVSAIVTSFQGCCVAVLFCFCNGEVHSVLKMKLNRYGIL